MSTRTFSVPSPDILSRPLRTITPIIQKNNPLEILRGVLVEIGPQGCTLTGTDLEQTVQVRVPEVQGNTGEECAFVLFPRTMDMLQRLPDMRTEFAFDPGRQTLQIFYGDSEQNHKTLPTEDYPTVPEVEGVSFSVTGVEWQRVAYAVDPKEVRQYFTGIYMDFANKKLVGTNVVKLGMLDFGDCIQGQEQQENQGIILPLKAVNFISQLKGTAELTVNEDGNMVKVVSGDMVLYSRLIAGKFPNYSHIIDSFSGDNAATRIVVDVAELADAVERARLMAVAENILVFEFKDAGAGKGEISVIARGIEGTVREVLGCEFQGEEFTTGFNWRQLLETLKQTKTDKVFWGLHGHSPSAFRGIDKDDRKDDKWLGILVPAVPKEL